MSNSIPSNAFNEESSIELPAFRGLPSVKIEVTATKNAEKRLIEAKTVNPSTYTDLEYTFNEAYRELKRNLATIGYQILKTKNELEKSKANALLDKYQEYIKDKGSKFDNASMRDAFLTRDQEYMEAKERLDSLQALEIFLEGRVKVMENVCQYMRNAIRMITRSGVTSDFYYRK